MAAGGLLWPRLILFGDSITQGSFENGGWGAAIANRLVRKCDVLNRGLSGYNTRWALTVMPKIITQPPDQSTIAAVVIFLGANDSALKDVNPVQHIPLTEYAENLKHLIQYLKSIGICEEKVILITPPPLDESAWEKACIAKGNKLDRYNSVTKEYAQACVKVATECGTGVLDLWTLMQIGDFSSYLLDGLHLSEKGSRFLETHLWPMLEKRTENLPMIFPYWRDIDHLNCQASLLL
ncbi:isoamyl acetate-hydrolyzing esterase 1 homolog isoform X2 [Hypanus sabinus]|uniref:isoamyl acetate-hydrolyzing esterase 1 homolog isoform X2 n=1 Tax=Hypanus sabinus TaxID=79690 RepID=UPI0028C3C16A|nr:isoamyl acetate-hydrolyzing esterase 1 homolog isoform X2 [Hypanus sabinus]